MMTRDELIAENESLRAKCAAAAVELEKARSMIEKIDANVAKEQELLAEARADLIPFLAIWAAQYQRDYNLNGLAPTHYDMLKKTGARMDSFKRATNARHDPDDPTEHR